MMQKNAAPSAEQREVMKRQGLSPQVWTVVKEFAYSMIVRNRITGEFKVIDK